MKIKIGTLKKIIKEEIEGSEHQISKMPVEIHVGDEFNLIADDGTVAHVYVEDIFIQNIGPRANGFANTTTIVSYTYSASGETATEQNNLKNFLALFN